MEKSYLIRERNAQIRLCSRIRTFFVRLQKKRMLENIVTNTEDHDQGFRYFITETNLYNFDPLKPHFHIVKLGFTGVYIFFSYFFSKTWIMGTG